VKPGRRCQRGLVTLMGAIFVLVTISLLLMVLQRTSGNQLLDTTLQNDSVEALFLAESAIERASYHYTNGTACAALAGITDSTSRGSFTVQTAVLQVTGDCRIQVEGRAGSTGAANAAVRTISADLRLSTADGWAVGDNGTILRWDGSAWNSTASGTTRNLNGVHCVTSNDCWAVGNQGTILHWNGSTWSSTTSGTNADLFAVACQPNAPDDCYAAGGDVIFGGFLYTAVVRHWNGSTWNNSLNAWSFGQDVRLTDISCPATICEAVLRNGLAIRFNGNWSNDNSGTSTPLNGIDCTSDVDCQAVGNRSGNNFTFDRRASSGWTPSTLNSSRREDLRAVSCVGAAFCKAVGDRRGGRFTIVGWDGTNWTVESFNHAQRDHLNGVHCITANDCWAVGDYRNGATGNSLHWDGLAWTYVGTPVKRDLNDVHFPASGGTGSATLVRWQEVISN